MAVEKALVNGEYEDLTPRAIPNKTSNHTSNMLSTCVGSFSQNTDDFTLSYFGAILGNKHRLSILNALKTCPKPVVGFAGQIGISPQHVRHHLSVLIKNNLVASKEMVVAGVRGDKKVMVYGLSVLGEKALDAYRVGGLK